MSNDEVQHPTKKIKKIEPTAEVSNVDMVASAEDKDEIQNEEPIDPIDAAIEEALVGQEVLATTEQEAQDNSAGDDESVEGAYDARARSLSEDSTINSQDNLQEEIKDEEQRHQTLERIEVLKGEIADLERKLSGFQSRLSEQINPIMKVTPRMQVVFPFLIFPNPLVILKLLLKNRFEEIIKRLNINIDDKKTELAELHATLGNRASG